jgi:hypothetical protein
MPHRYTARKLLITQQQRIELLRRCVEPDGKALTFRVAALKCSDLQALPDGLHLSLGNLPVLVPAQIAPMFWNTCTTGPTSRPATAGASGSSPAPSPDSTSTPTS